MYGIYNSLRKDMEERRQRDDCVRNTGFMHTLADQVHLSVFHSLQTASSQARRYNYKIPECPETAFK